MNSKKPT